MSSDRSNLKKKLRRAEVRIAEGELAIDDQRTQTAALEQEGKDSSGARRHLRLLEEQQALLIVDRDRISAVLENHLTTALHSPDLKVTGLGRESVLLFARNKKCE
jgi:hypothetical protein